MKPVLHFNTLVRCFVPSAFFVANLFTSVIAQPNAWQIFDYTNSTGSLLYYTHQLSPQNRMAATNHGFRYTVQARFVNDFNGTKSMYMSYGLGNRRLQIWWYLDPNHDLIAETGSGDIFLLTTNGTGTNFFHTHELVFNASNQTASYLVDGALQASNLVPVGNTGPAGPVQWGAGSSAGQAQVNFRRVSFEITNTFVALYDAGTNGNPVTAPNPTNSGWILTAGAGTGVTNISPDVASLPTPLAVTTLAATDVRPRKATLSGAVTLGGLAASAWVEWGTNIDFTNSSTPQFVKATTNTTSIFAVATGLVAEVTYYFRCVATNVLGVAYGQPVTFATTPTWVVTTLANSGPGSLREASDEAVAGDTITFSINGTIQLTSQFNVSNSITILGPGPDNLRIDGGGISRIFRILDGTTNFFSGMTLTNGHAPDGVARGEGSGGGAIHNIATLTLSNCVVTGNQAGNGANGVNVSHSGGGGGDGGGIYNNGVLTLIACAVTNNATGRGGRGADGAQGASGLPNGGRGGDGGSGGYGGGVFSANKFTSVGSIISSNSAAGGGNAGNGGDAFSDSFGNGGNGGDGGISGFGGGLFLSGSATLANCIVQNNTTGFGGVRGSGGRSGALGGAHGSLGIRGPGGEGGGVEVYASATFSHCVITNNSATYGAGISTASALLTLNHCTVSHNFAQGYAGGILAYSSGLLALNDCTLNDNLATDAGGLGVFNSMTTVVINRSTFAGNIANRFGGGIYNEGTLRIENSTITQNRGNEGAGIYNIPSGVPPLLLLTNCTLSGNVTTNGGNASGVFNLVPNSARQ